jgi:putative proteasome-type protease
MTVEDGIVGVADTRVTSGNECITAKKVDVYERAGGSFFIMTAGLRSVRDKSLTYFEELQEHFDDSVDRLFKVVNAMGEQVRRVEREDRDALVATGLQFQFSALIGGQMRSDNEHKIYLLYPQGNWVEVSHGTPYGIIGALGYGKPVLDRTLHFSDTLQHALKVGCLAFDSTRISAADVDFPIDVVLYRRNSFRVIERRYNKDDLRSLTEWWQDRLRGSVQALPADALDDIFQVRAVTPAIIPAPHPA